MRGAAGRCGEAAQRAPDFAFAQPLERAVAQLPHPLTRDAQHGADFLERVLAAPVQTEVQTQHLGIAGRERAQRFLDFIGEEAVHGFLFRIGHLVGYEALDECAIPFRVHGRIESHVTGVERGERLHDVHREPRQVRQLLRIGLTTQLLPQDLRRLDNAREVRRAIERHTHGPPLTCQ